MRMGLSVLRGEQPSWPQVDRPAELVEGDPAEVWHGLVEQCRAALEGADLDTVMDTPMGPSTVRQRLAFPAIDLYVHAWDIGQAAGLPVTIPDDAIEFAHHYLDSVPTERMRGDGGAFGAEVEAPADATPTERFIAWTGRAPRPA
jgi:trehalose 6-phosphate phosphatase